MKHLRVANMTYPLQADATELRRLQEDLARSISLAVQFFVKTNVYSIIAWLFLIIGTHYFLVIPSSVASGVGAGGKYQILEVSVAVTMIAVGLILNVSALTDIRDKWDRLTALEVATYDYAKKTASYDNASNVINQEWKIFGELLIQRNARRTFVARNQFYCFVAIHFGLAALTVIV